MATGENKYSDSELVARIRGGERELFSVLADRYKGMLYRTCMGYLHNSDEAADLTQEIFLQAYLSLSGFRGDSSLSTWFYRIAVNAALNRIRQYRRSPFLNTNGSISKGQGKDAGQAEAEIPDFDDPETILIRDEHRIWLGKLLDTLPDSQRTALVLSKYDELSQKEIAEIMETTESAVEALLIRAKRNLRERIGAGLQKKNQKERRKK